jgi:hypothetical protein
MISTHPEASRNLIDPHREFTALPMIVSLLVNGAALTDQKDG